MHRGARDCAISVAAPVARGWLPRGGTRIASGVLVTSRVSNRLAVDSGLMEGDVIHSLNRTPNTSVDILKDLFNQRQPGEPAAKQIARNGKLTHFTFETE